MIDYSDEPGPEPELTAEEIAALDPNQLAILDVPAATPELEEIHQSVVVNFATMEDLAAFGDLLGRRIPPHLKAIWYPE